jgi:glyoxylase-like metal-dependent hydrolase (beta-lactamase superfamily II)
MARGGAAADPKAAHSTQRVRSSQQAVRVCEAARRLHVETPPMTARSISCLALLALAAPAAAQDQDFSKVEIVTTQLAPGLAMLVGAGGNIAVSTGADGPVIVDDQFAPLAPKITAAVRALQDAPLRFVINTHHHFDHTGGNEAFGSAGALIFAHENVRLRLSQDQVWKLRDGFKVPASPPKALPVVTFDDGVTLHWNDETIRIEHVASAHTDGDSQVWFERANAVHMGDTFVNGFYPFIDIESGGSVAGIIDSANRALAQLKPDTKIIPGHGPLATPADLTKYRDMLVDVKARIESAIASGQTLDAYLASKPLADLEGEWGDGFMKTDQVITLIWLNLTAK